MASLGRAFVSVHADTSPFANELRRFMRRLAVELREDSDRAGRLIGRRVGLRMREGLREGFSRRPLTVDADVRLSRRSLSGVDERLRGVTRRRTVEVDVDRRGFARSLGTVASLLGTFVLSVIRIFGDLFNFGRQIGQILGETFRNLSGSLNAAGTAAVGTAAAVVQLVAALAAIAVVATIVVGALATLLAILVLLVQTVQLLLTLTPGLIVALIAGIGPLVLVFSNLGEAIKGTASDLETFQERIEDLGRETAASLTSLRGLVQFFLGIREQVQESFFAPINDVLQQIRNNLVPVFEDGFIRVAGAAGQFASELIALFDHPMAVPFFDALFGLADLGFDEVGSAVVGLIGSIANLIDESIPNLRRAIEGISDEIDGWADSINEFANDPNFQETLDGWEESFETLRDLWDEIVELAGNLVEGFQDEGLDVVRELTGLLERINTFLSDSSGEFFFEGLRVAAGLFLISLFIILAVFGTMVSLLGQISFLIQQIGSFGDFLRIVFLSILPPAFRLSGWGEIFEAIWERIFTFVTGIVDAVRRFIDVLRGDGIPFTRQLRDAFSRTAGFATRIRDRFRNFSGTVRGLLSPLRTLRNIMSTIAFHTRSFRDAAADALGFLGQVAGVAGGAGGGAVLGFLQRFFAEGGIVTRPTNAVLGESGPEVVIPLTRPDRARELLAMSGLANLIRGGDGSSMMSPGSGGPLQLRLVFESDGNAASDAVLALMQRSVRIRGGNVQVVVGK